MLLCRARSLTRAVRYFSVEVTITQAATDSYSVSTTTTTNSSTKSMAGSVRGGGRDTLGGKLLRLVYTKRSAVIAIQKWKEEGHSVRKYELNRIVRELRKLKRYKHALEVCEWMRQQDDIKLQEGDYAVHLDLIAKVRGINSAEKFFEDLPDKMNGQATCSALLHNYVQHKDSSKAEALMEKMSECGFLNNPLPYNHMMSLYLSNGQLEKVLGFIKDLKKNTSPDIVSFNLWLAVCGLQNDVETAERLFLELKKAKIDPDWVTYSTLTSLYIKQSLNEKASLSLKEMEKVISPKVRIAYPSLISLHTNLGNKEEVNRIWKMMKSMLPKMNDAEYTCMISSLLKLKEFVEAENLYTEWESLSVTGDSRVSNLLLAAFINKNQMEMAKSFYYRMVSKGIEPSYTTWELLTWGYLKQRQMEEVLDCFKKAVGRVNKWKPDDKLIRQVFNILEENGNTEGAEQLLVILRKVGHVNTEVYNLLLQTYAKAGKVPRLVAKRMKNDNVQMDEQTCKLIKLTSEMCISDVASCLS